MNSDNVSVCLASWNGERYIVAQIDSILMQLGPNDELVVADDGSTDATPAILASYGDRLRVVGLHRAGGVVRNFERALASAKGEFIVLSDQDDIWLDGRLDLIRKHLRDVTLLMTNGEVVDATLKSCGQDIKQLVRFRLGFFRNYFTSGYVGCCMAFRRELLDVALPFPAHIAWHDWYIALLGELLFRCQWTSDKTILYRRHGGNSSSTGKRSGNTLMTKLMMRFWMARAVVIGAWRFYVRRLRNKC